MIHRINPGSRIHVIPGIGINVITPRSAAAAVSWWLAGGIPAANVAGVWQAKGAASLDASYLRLAGDEGNADIDPTVVGGVAPGWDATNGWQFDGSNDFLATGIVPDSSMAAIFRFSDFTGIDRYQSPLGSANVGPAAPYYFFFVNRASKVRYAWGNSYKDVSPAMTAGVLAINNALGYRNGVAETITISTWSGTAAPVFIGKCNNNSTPCPIYIQAAAFYKAAITDEQVAAVTTAVLAL